MAGSSPSSKHAPSSSSSSGKAAPIPPPIPVETHPNRKPRPNTTAASSATTATSTLSPDPTRLAPEDAYLTHSPPRLRSGNVVLGNRENLNHAAHLRLLHRTVATPAAVAALRPPPAVPGPGFEPKGVRDKKDRALSRKGKKKAPWKKLLWVKQSCTCWFLLLYYWYWNGMVLI